MGYAANGDEWERADHLANNPQSLKPEHRRGIGFGGGSEDRTDGEVINWELRGRNRLFDVVRRVADDGIWTEKLSRGLGRHVVLAQVNSVRANRKRNVNTIVDDQLHTRSQSNLCLVIELAGGHMLFAELD